MMYLHIGLVVLTLATAQKSSTMLDESLLQEIFGSPPTTTPVPGVTHSPKLEEVTVRTTDSTSVFKDEAGEVCQCVPYYLCDNNLNAVDANNQSVTGYGTLDIRFREDECQESVERCCKTPKTEDEVQLPVPDPTKLKGCGFRNPKGLDFTITGGTGSEAQFGEFPWVVALLDSLTGTYGGVGVLIHPQVVMTGAHIASKFTENNLKARAGEWDTQTQKERLKFQERKVSDIIIHEGFRPRSLWNDIALLRLVEPFELADHINIICLPVQDEDFDDSKNCVANGWGKNVFGLRGRYAVILKRVEQDMVPHARCTMQLQRTRLGKKFILHHSFVCAGGEEGKDTCQGDGGAPLACPIGGDRYKLAGLVAWGIGCGERDVPGVYTAVAKFRSWVDSKMAIWGYENNKYDV